MIDYQVCHSMPDDKMSWYSEPFYKKTSSGFVGPDLICCVMDGKEAFLRSCGWVDGRYACICLVKPCVAVSSSRENVSCVRVSLPMLGRWSITDCNGCVVVGRFDGFVV